MKKNLLYSMIYELVIAFYPIILIPYLSSTIGKEGVGIYSYTYSVIGFFLLACQLGVNTCGTRAIAQTRYNKDNMTKTFRSIFAIQLGVSAITILCFFVFLFTIGKSFQLYFLLLLPFLAGQAIRISWLFLGLEQLKVILFRNLLIRIVSAIMIMIFVKDENDLNFYFIIMSMSYFLGDVSVWPRAWNILSKAKPDITLIKKYIVPMFLMFLPILALRGSYYVDEIMLGLFQSTGDVAIYENVYRVINMPLQLYTVLANVMIAHASHLVSTSKKKQNVQYVVASIDLSSAIMILIIFGLASCADEFVPWYMGTEFMESIYVMRILPFVLIFSGITSILRTQYFIPMGEDKKYVCTVVIGVIINIILNFLLVSYFSYIGVAVATVISEMIITILSIIVICRHDNIIRAFKYFPLYLSAGIAISVITRIIGYRLGPGITTNVVQGIIGLIVYLIIVLGVMRLFYKKDEINILRVLLKK